MMAARVDGHRTGESPQTTTCSGKGGYELVRGGGVRRGGNVSVDTVRSTTHPIL